MMKRFFAPHFFKKKSKKFVNFFSQNVNNMSWIDKNTENFFIICSLNSQLIHLKLRATMKASIDQTEWIFLRPYLLLVQISLISFCMFDFGKTCIDRMLEI